MKSASRPMTRRGFTLIELLVVIGIILLLLAILLPVVSQVRTRAYQATTESQMNRIMAACQNYFHDFNAYPGPIANAYLSGGALPGADPSPSAFAPIGGTAVTSSENLVLGLMGFLSPPTTATPAVTFTQGPAYNPPTTPLAAPTHDVLSLNRLHPAVYHYIDFVADELSPGPANLLDYLAPLGATLTDSWMPEFVDRFPEHMPILYVRANVGNPVIGADGMNSGNNDSGWQYNYNELKDYGCFVRDSNGNATPEVFTPTLFTFMQGLVTAGTLADDVAVPYLSFNDFFSNPNITNSVRGKDGFVLIDAGVDHIYGTHDDIIVTP